MKSLTDNCRTLGTERRPTIKAVAAVLAYLFVCAASAHAQTTNAIWVGTTSDWNTPTNWSPSTFPGGVPTGVATFAFPGAVKSLTFSQVTTVGELQFALPGYNFAVSGDNNLTIDSTGITTTSTVTAPTFNVTGLAALTFNGKGTTADQATIIAGLENDTTGGFQAGFIMFRGSSTAGTATITANVDSNIEFHDSSTADHSTLIATTDGFIFFNETSTAGNATLTNTGGQIVFGHNDGGEFLGGTPTAGDATIITNSGGQTLFENEGSGGNARFITNEGGTVDISALTNGGTTAGSIEGAGTYKLGKNEFTVGSNNLSTTVSGLIEDGGQANGTGGSLVKVGTGTLTLLGANSYSGGTTIVDGTIEVGTLVAADQPVSTALGTGNVFVDPGTLQTTSASTHTPLIIQVNGNYTQAAGGTLRLGIGGTQGEQYDHMQVGGNANLNGTLSVFSLNNFHPSAGDLYGVLRTNGTRQGNFSLVDDSQFNTNPNISHELRLVDVEIVAPNGIILAYVAAPPTVGPSPTPPSPGASPTPPSPGASPTPNPKPPIIDVIPTPIPPINPDEPLDLSFVLAALNPTAEQLTSMFEISFSGANTQRFNLTDRMTQIQRGSTGFVSAISPVSTPAPSGKEVIPQAFTPGPENHWGVWVNGWGNWVSVDNDNSVKGYDFTTGGVTVGLDYRVTEHIAVGGFGTYAHTWTNFNPGDVDVNTGGGGLYATYWNQGFYINTGIYGGGNGYDTHRQTLLQGQFASGNTDGYEFSTFVDTGYNFHFDHLTFGPVFAAQYTNVHINGYTEHGGFLPLNVHGDSEESWRTDLGFQVYKNWHVGKVTLIPSLFMAWEHEYKYSRLPITFSAAGFPGASATTFGPDVGHDSFIINAGAGVQWTPRISTYIGYQGQLGRTNYSANGVTGTISFSF